MAFPPKDCASDLHKEWRPCSDAKPPHRPARGSEGQPHDNTAGGWRPVHNITNRLAGCGQGEFESRSPAAYRAYRTIENSFTVGIAARRFDICVSEEVPRQWRHAAQHPYVLCSIPVFSPDLLPVYHKLLYLRFRRGPRQTAFSEGEMR